MYFWVGLIIFSILIMNYWMCFHLEVVSFTRDFFAAFSSVLVRMYWNYTVQHFSDLISQISLSDEGKIIWRIFQFALDLLHKFFDINYMFFYEFFDLFDESSSSKCYVICSNKPKFGPYDRPKYSLEVIMFEFFMFSSHLNWYCLTCL